MNHWNRVSTHLQKAIWQAIEIDDREGVVRLVDQALTVLSDERKR
jgi:hypothetical protein